MARVCQSKEMRGSVLLVRNYYEVGLTSLGILCSYNKKINCLQSLTGFLFWIVIAAYGDCFIKLPD